MSRTILQIVPRLPPPAEGVGSFAIALADALRDRHGIASRFAAAAADPRALDEALTAAGADLPVLLHYAGYGYQPRGCPIRLISRLRAWKRRGGNRLLTVFHEVYAGGPPWRSSFWLSPLQRHLASEVARLSDGMVVSLEIYRRLLLRLVPEQEVEVLPVFSTVGEPAVVPPLAERRRRLVLFGGPGARARAYGPLASSLTAACRDLGIEEICDVGAGEAQVPSGLPVRRLGEMAAADLGELLLGSFAGFATYPPPFLAKSTAFAAYCAHGLLPVCAHGPGGPGEGDPSLPPFWPAGTAVATAPALQAIADRARAWYAGHTLGRHADTCRDLLQ